MLLAAAWSGAAQAADSAEPASRLIPDLRLSVIEEPGELSLRLPLAAERRVLYGVLSPYLSLGTSTPLSAPGAALPAAGLKHDPDGLEDLRMGAGMALPISGRVQLYGEYRFLRGRLDAGVGRDLLQREPDSGDFRAGFSVRFD